MKVTKELDTLNAHDVVLVLYQVGDEENYHSTHIFNNKLTDEDVMDFIHCIHQTQDDDIIVLHIAR